MSKNNTLRGAALTSRARKIALDAHGGQIDKSGEPYVGHPLRVADLVKGLGAKYEAVAYLHDVVEDTELELDDLREQNIPEDVVEAVNAMSRDKESETYEQYLERVKQNSIAYQIKFADITDNLSPQRFDSLDRKTRERLLQKYINGLRVLLSK